MKTSRFPIFFFLLSFITLLSSSCSIQRFSATQSRQMQTVAKLPEANKPSLPEPGLITPHQNGSIAQSSIPTCKPDAYVTKVHKAAVPFAKPTEKPVKMIAPGATNSKLYLNLSRLKSNIKSPSLLKNETNGLAGGMNCVAFIILVALLALVLALLTGGISLSWLPLTTTNIIILIILGAIVALMAVVKLFDLLAE